MKLLMILLSFCLFCGSSFAQSDGYYSEFRTGKFVFDGINDNSVIIRTKKKQIEITNNGKSKLITTIEWISDSSYILTFKKSVNMAPGCFQKGDWIKVVFLSKSGNGYYCHFSSNKCGEGKVNMIIVH